MSRQRLSVQRFITGVGVPAMAALVFAGSFPSWPAAQAAGCSPDEMVSDADGDGTVDCDDNCPLVANAPQEDFDGDGLGDSCETGPVLADIDNSGRVDGFDLALFGRAFATAPTDPNYDPRADLDRDGDVSGMDQATLANDFAGEVDSSHRLFFPDGCRPLFFSGEFLQADECLRGKLDVNPGDREANFFRALTRLLAILHHEPAGTDAQAPGAGLQALVLRLGATMVSNGPLDLSIAMPDTLPVDAPTSGEVQQFLEAVFLQEIGAAVTENLAAIDTDFSLTLTAEEAAVLGLGAGPLPEIDFGDVKILQAALGALKGVLQTFLIAQDLDVDLNTVRLMDVFRLPDFLAANPDFLTLAPDGAAVLADAKQILLAAIQNYFAGSHFIRTLDDADQTDDLVTIEPADLPGEEALRTRLGEIGCSLDGLPLEAITSMDFSCLETGTPLVQGRALNLSGYYDTPFGFRDMLPPAGFDETCGQSFFDTTGPSPFPDPTIGGVFPDLTQDDLRQVFSPQVDFFLSLHEFLVMPGETAQGFVFFFSDGPDLAPPLQLTDITLADGSVFSLVLPGTPPLFLCADGDRDFVQVEVLFSPAEAGCFTDTLTVETNDEHQPVLTFPLTGRSGVASCPP